MTKETPNRKKSKKETPKNKLYIINDDEINPSILASPTLLPETLTYSNDDPDPDFTYLANMVKAPSPYYLQRPPDTDPIPFNEMVNRIKPIYIGDLRRHENTKNSTTNWGKTNLGPRGGKKKNSKTKKGGKKRKNKSKGGKRSRKNRK